MWEKCDLESKPKKLFLFFGEEIISIGQHVLADAYEHNVTLMPLNAPAIGLTLQDGMPFTLIDKWMGIEPYLKAREDGVSLLRNWVNLYSEDLSTDGIYWPEFDSEAMLWFWKIVGLVHNFAKIFEDHGGESLQIIGNQRCRPALYYYPSDIASSLLKGILGDKTRIINVNETSNNNFLYTPSISFDSGGKSFSTADPSTLKGKIVFAVNLEEIHRFSGVLQDLIKRFPGELAVVSISPGQENARNMSLKYGIPVVAPSSVPLNTDGALVSRFLEGYGQLTTLANEPMIQSAFEHTGFQFNYCCGYRWPVLRNNYIAWRELWEKNMPRAVIISRLPDCESQLPAESARQIGIPIISLPHAEFLPEEKKGVDADCALFNTSLSIKILKDAGFDERQLHICRDIINVDEYETLSTPLESDNKPWNCLVVTYPATMGESFTPKGCPGAQLEALQILANPPDNISEKLRIRIKTHPAYPELELYRTADNNLEKKIFPARTPLIHALKNMDLVIVVNCSYSVVIHILRQKKPIIFFYNDPFYINGTDVHSAAHLFLPSGILAQTRDELWVAVKSFFTDEVFAERLKANSIQFSEKFLDDSTYPSAGELVQQVLQEKFSNPTEHNGASPSNTNPYKPSIHECGMDQLLPDHASIPVNFLKISSAIGGMSLLELGIPCKIARKLEPRNVFEFGNFMGETSLRIAANTQAAIYTLDLPLKERVDYAHPQMVDSDNRVSPEKKNGKTINATYTSRITKLGGDSQEFDFSPFFETMDFVLVDSNDEYDIVLRDSMNAFKMLRRGGVIVWDKYSESTPGVMCALRTVRERFPLFHISETSLVIYIGESNCISRGFDQEAS